ncbi:MAG: 1,6-anhydro-N-acetylmuramyl-L-alanine amidase AmpD [Nitrosomonadales bacterium]|nr:1,6-anhydro-N-acetylmuramyl-L-alanine amidase AmpD [Nitrosomonadales bacterium]
MTSCSDIFKINKQGFVKDIKLVKSPNFDNRPNETEITLLVIHNISLPPGIYGGKFIENFFTNSLDPTIDPFFYKIKDIKVSAHFVIERTGSLIQYVSAVKRAWHAGESFWNGRSDCNDYSIGIELEGSDNIEYTDIQYAKLNALIECLTEAYPIKDVVGHSDIAPKRKTDPGPSFRWDKIKLFKKT